MIISITGTPGTGKTAAARILAKNICAKLISIGSLVEKGKVRSKYDKQRKTRIVDEKDLEKAVRKEIKKGKTNVVEGHLSHLIKADYVFVLRTNPVELHRRLKKKRWHENKIKENVLAEFLDATAIEALGKNSRNRVFEINTTAKRPAATARLIKTILNNYSLQKTYRAGKMDWTEKYKGMILKV